MNLLIKELNNDVHAQLKALASLRGATIRDFVADLLAEKGREYPVLDPEKKFTAVKK